MEVKEIEALIRFHKDGLDQYRQHISPSAQYLEAQTIKALEELKSKQSQIDRTNQLIQDRKKEEK